MQNKLSMTGLESRLLATILVFLGMLTLGPALARADTSVSVVDNSFSPQTITIAPGDTVTWTNNGSMNHTVTADDGSFSSGSLSPGQSFTHTFATVGNFPYYCQFHGAPGGIGMSGAVMVSSSASSANSTSTSTSTPSNSGIGTGTSTTGTSTSATSTSGAPVLSNGNVVPNDTGATISWNTDVNSDAQVAYGATTAYTTTTASDGASATSHTVVIAGLMPGTLYHFQAMSTANGVTGMSPDETFTTTNSASSTNTGTSTATSTPGTGGTSTSTGTTTPSTVDLPYISTQIAQLEAQIKSLEARIQSYLSGGGTGGYGNGGYGNGTTTPSIPPSGQGNATVYASSYSVAPGGTIQINGQGFAPNETVSVSAGGTQLGTAQTDGSGNFSTSGSAPNTSGSMTYTFTGQTSGKDDTVVISVQ